MDHFKSVLKAIVSRLPGRNNEATRSKWLERTLQEIPKGSRILDAGCGEQQFRKFCSHLVYVGQDFAGYDGKGDQRGLQTGSWDQTKLDIVCDIVSVPEPDSSFDAILCTEVLEHVVDPVAVLREFSRLLKPQGYLILTAPFVLLPTSLHIIFPLVSTIIGTRAIYKRLGFLFWRYRRTEIFSSSWHKKYAEPSSWRSAIPRHPRPRFQ